MLFFHLHLSLNTVDILSSMTELFTLKLMFSSPGVSNWNSSSVSIICISCYINSIIFTHFRYCRTLGVGPGVPLWFFVFCIFFYNFYNLTLHFMARKNI